MSGHTRPQSPRIVRCLWKIVRLFAYFLFAILLAGISILTYAGFVEAPTRETDSPEVAAQFKWLAHVVERSVDKGRLDIYTGYSDFCGKGTEWDYGFYTFYSMCLNAYAQSDPSKLEFAKAQIDHCARLMMDFSQEAPPEEILASQQSPELYSGTLVSGYQCIVLSIREALIGDGLFNPMLQGVAEKLNESLEIQLESSHGVWTSDQATHLYAIWLADSVLGSDHSATRERWLNTMQTQFMEAETDLLYSQVSIQPDKIDSPPRGSSIAWTAIFLAEVFPEFAAHQYAGLMQHRARTVCTLAAFNEFPGHSLLKLGDQDSGPLILGFSPSATGFSLAAQGQLGEHGDYQRCYRIFEIFGRPLEDAKGKRYRMGNAMGDAILLYSKVAIRP